MKLTKRQDDVLHYIKNYIVSNGYPPTVREIGSALDISSPATTHAHLKKLEEKGMIRKEGTKNRAIELLVENEFLPKNDNIVEVPLLGKVTAGNPILAIEQPDNYFSLPTYLIPNNKDVFVLEVQGDSMINAGIFDGDHVVVARSKDAHNGEIVVAMTEENEVTLKRWYKEKDHIRLQPENDTLDPIILSNATILGKAVGLYRKF